MTGLYNGGKKNRKKNRKKNIKKNIKKNSRKIREQKKKTSVKDAFSLRSYNETASKSDNIRSCAAY